MYKIFCPNGIHSMDILNNLAQKEFGDKIGKCNSYGELKRQIVRALKRLSPKELEENKLNTLVGIKHLEENDFGNFVSVRLAYWGMIIAIAAMVIGDIPVYTYFDLSKKGFAWIVCMLLSVLLTTMSRTIHCQHDNLEYFNFKLICFEELIDNKKK